MHSEHLPTCRTAFTSGQYLKSSCDNDIRSSIDPIFVGVALAECAPFAKTSVGPPLVKGVGPTGTLAKFGAYIIGCMYAGSIGLCTNG